MGILTNTEMPALPLCRLLASRKDRTLCDWPEDEWSQLVDVAISHKLGPLLYHACISNNMTIDVGGRSRLQRSYLAASAEYMKKSHVLEQILSSMEAESVSVIPLKGICIAEKYYPTPALRPMVDLDILVRYEDAAKALSALKSLGYEMPFNIETAAKFGGHLPDMAGTAGVKLDVHTKLTIREPEATARRPMDMDAIWSRSSPDELSGTPCRSLAVEDNLLFLASHIAKHEFSQSLLQIHDVKLIIEKEAVDWGCLEARAAEAGIARILEAVLFLAHDLFACDVPVSYRTLRCTREVEKELRHRALGLCPAAEQRDREYDSIARFRDLSLPAKFRYLCFSLFSSQAICTYYGLRKTARARLVYLLPRLTDLCRRYSRRAVDVYIRGKEARVGSFQRRFEPVRTWLTANHSEVKT